MKRRIAATKCAIMCAILALALTGILGTGGPALAADEFVVSTTTAPNVEPRASKAVPLAGGDVVIVWEIFKQATFGATVYGQLISATGTKVGSEFHVATLRDWDNGGVGITALPDGGFAVVWIDPVGAQATIRGQRLSATGAKVGDVFVVLPLTNDWIVGANIAALADGQFLVIWSREQAVGPGTSWDILAQRYSANGSKVGQPFTVSNRAGNNPFANIISVGTSYLVTWSAEEGVYARRLARNGQPIGAEYQVNTTDNGFTVPQAAQLLDGLVVAVWDAVDTYVQRFTVAGKKRGAELRPTQRGEGNKAPQVAALDDGGFVVIWARDKRDVYNCFARRYSDSGRPTGSEMPVNQTSECHGPGVVPLSAGGYLAYWAGAAVMARAFDP